MRVLKPHSFFLARGYIPIPSIPSIAHLLRVSYLRQTPSRYLRLQTIPSSDFVVAKSLSIDELIQVQAGAGGMKSSGEKGLEVLEVSQIEVKVLEISE